MKADYANGERIETALLSNGGAYRWVPHITVSKLVSKSEHIEWTRLVDLTIPALFGKAKIELWPEDARKLGEMLIEAADYERRINANADQRPQPPEPHGGL